MENVLDEILSDGTADNTEDQTDFDHSFDLTEDDLKSEDEEETTVDEADANDDYDSEDNDINEPTNAAFAQMRTQNKEFQNKLNELDTLAKNLGMRDVDDFITKAREAKVKKDAASQGIPLEVAQELEEMRALKQSIVEERNNNAIEEKKRNLASNLQTFVEKNNISEAGLDKLSQDLENDGFTIEQLIEMPTSAVNRILSSYVDTKYQKSLERKNAIRKELPISQTSKTDYNSLNKEIDTLARQLAGKI